MVTDEQVEHSMALKDSFIDNQPRCAMRGAEDTIDLASILTWMFAPSALAGWNAAAIPDEDDEDDQYTEALRRLAIPDLQEMLALRMLPVTKQPPVPGASRPLQDNTYPFRRRGIG